MPSARYTKHYYSEMHADRKSNPLHKLRRIVLAQTLPETLNRQVFSIRFTVRMAFRKEMEIQGLEPRTFRL